MRIWSVILLLVAAAAPAVEGGGPTPDLRSSIVGLWEPAETSIGGIGEIVEVTVDGRFVQTQAFVRNGFYRVIGDRLVVAEKPPAVDADVRKEPTFRIDGDSLSTVGPDGTTNRMERVGHSEAGKAPIVGVWIDHTLGSPAYVRFGEDGGWSYRAAIVSRTDCYDLDGNVLTLTGIDRPGPAKVSVEVSNDRLLLAAADGRRSGYRRAADAWYDRDVENVGMKRRLDPKARLADAEAKLESARGELDRFYTLGDAALLNAETGSPEKASRLAEELLRSADRHRDDWNYGNAIHKGNLTLGLVALHSGNVAEAKSRLLAAGKTPGSPQLDSFGPNMVLAKELLDKGERDAVVEYFDLCRKFWKMDRGELDEWTSQVRAGAVPQFGANLRY